MRQDKRVLSRPSSTADDAPSHHNTILHIINGRTIEHSSAGALGRLGRFLAEPFVSAWKHRDLIVTILRRELAERFKGSAAGWVWAIVAPLLSLVTYVVAFSGA